MRMPVKMVGAGLQKTTTNRIDRKQRLDQGGLDKILAQLLFVLHRHAMLAGSMLGTTVAAHQKGLVCIVSIVGFGRSLQRRGVTHDVGPRVGFDN